MNASSYVTAIHRKGLSIYDSIEVGDPNLWIPAAELEELLHNGLSGTSVKGLPIRTRSKRVKEKVCKTLGYQVPTSFKKEQPRFPGQQFDVYVQKSNNLQIWNEQVAPSRRYVVVNVSQEDVIDNVRVVTGETLAELDTTGTLTGKYQARLDMGEQDGELISQNDTAQLVPLLEEARNPAIFEAQPTDYAEVGSLLPIKAIFDRLEPLIGASFLDPGFDQERNRGTELHRRICNALGYNSYQDDGRFPDIVHQLLEVKLQTSPTIDLGVALPNNTDPLDIPKIRDVQPRYRDVRYAIFYGSTSGDEVTLSHLYVTTGKDFFSRFNQFGGKELNQKIQIHLPDDFFD
ncbi:MAG: restriction endonuclease [Bacteroidetes bacterium QS_8_64_10]|nr:MAG: restriction endonuclease [Bacteroidetes bacterium QS_8_64_10]